MKTKINENIIPRYKGWKLEDYSEKQIQQLKMLIGKNVDRTWNGITETAKVTRALVSTDDGIAALQYNDQNWHHYIDPRNFDVVYEMLTRRIK